MTIAKVCLLLTLDLCLPAATGAVGSSSNEAGRALSDVGSKYPSVVEARKVLQELSSLREARKKGGDRHEKINDIVQKCDTLGKMERKTYLIEQIREVVESMRGNIEGEALFEGTSFLRDILGLYGYDLEDNVVSLFEHYASDQSLDQTVRALVMSSVIRSRIAKDRAAAPVDVIHYLVQNIDPLPHCTVPWKYYNVKKKREAYYHGSDGKKMIARYRQWRGSVESVKHDALVIILESYGIQSVTEIMKDIAKRAAHDLRGAHLAELAAAILVKESNRVRCTEEIKAFDVAVLEEYVMDMEDSGAFCCRHYAIQSLNIFYRKIGKDVFPDFKEGGNVLATVLNHGEDVAQVNRTFYGIHAAIGFCIIVLLSGCVFLCYWRKKRA